MKTGDPKKAIPLAVVALLVVGMAVFQILPKSDAKVQGRQAPKAESSGAEPSGSDSIAALTERVQEQLKADPFIHPMLTKKPSERGKPNSEENTAETGRPNLSEMGPVLQGELGGDPGAGQVPAIDGTSPYKPDPSDIARANQQSAQEAKKKIVVQGIVSVNSQRALVSINGAEAQTYEAGQHVQGLGTITYITDSAVIIRTLKRTVVLKVGQEEEL